MKETMPRLIPVRTVPRLIIAILCLQESVCLAADAASSKPAPPELVIQTGHLKINNTVISRGDGVDFISDMNKISSISFSPDGTQLITMADSDDNIIFWNVASGRQMGPLIDNADAFSLNPDGSQIATAVFGEKIILWDVKTGRRTRTFDEQLIAYTLAFSPDGKKIVTNGELLDNKPFFASFSPDGQRILCRSRWTKEWDIQTGLISWEQTRTEKECSNLSEKDKVYAFILDAKTGNRLLTIYGKDEDVTCASFSRDGKYIVLCSAGCEFSLYDANTGKQIRTYPAQNHEKVNNCLAISPDGKYVLTGSNDKKAILWDIETGKIVRYFQNETAVFSVAFSSNGKRIACGLGDLVSSVWDIQSGQQIMSTRGRYCPIRSVATSPEGTYISVGSSDGTLVVLDTHKGAVSQRLDGYANKPPSVDDMIARTGVSYMTFSADNKYLAAFVGKKVIQWEIPSGIRKDYTISADGLESYSLRDLKFSAECNQLHLSSPVVCIVPIISSRSFDNKIVSVYDHQVWIFTWNTQNGNNPQGVYKLIPVNYNARSISFTVFNKDATQLLIALNNGFLMLLDLSNGKDLWKISLGKEAVYQGTFSSDGTRVIIALQDKTEIIFDAKTGKQISTLTESQELITSVVLSTDGKKAITGSINEDIILVWDAETGKKAQSLKGHDHGINDIALLPDDHHVLTGGSKGTLCLWDINTEKLIFSFMSLSDGDWVAYTPDGRYDGSEGGRKLVAFRVGEDQKLVPAAQMDKNYFQPGLLREIMRNAGSNGN
jgi:WD40 repeat protein